MHIHYLIDLLMVVIATGRKKEEIPRKREEKMISQEMSSFLVIVSNEGRSRRDKPDLRHQFSLS